MPMRYNKLGDSGLLVSELSFGSWVTFQNDGQLSEAEACLALMKEAYLGGVNFFDNAEAYGAGEAETLMGEAIRLGIEREIWDREDLVVSTKLFNGTAAKWRDTAIRVNRVGTSRKHLWEGLRASLKRMQLEYVDLVFCHRPDPATPMEEVVRSFNEMINLRMCLYWGTSEWSAEQIRDACAIADSLGLIGPVMEQPQYNIFHRQRVEVEYARLYPRIGLTVWSPIAGGVLTGKYSGGVIPEGSRYALPGRSPPASLLQRAALADKLLPLCDRLGCTMGQLALAWTCVNPDVSTAIFGATSVERERRPVRCLFTLMHMR